MLRKRFVGELHLLRLWYSKLQAIFWPRRLHWAWLMIIGMTITTLPYLSSLTAAHESPPPTTELRGVWLTNVDSDVLFSQETTAAAIATLGNLHFNTVYPTVWNWGYTLYPSAVAQAAIGRSLDPEPRLQNRDMLQEVIDQAQGHKISVIPWFEFGFMAPADSSLAQRHPDWLTQRRNGSTIWWEGKRHQRVWLNPLHPEVQALITDLAVEIVSRYEVEGIQFDDHMGYPSDFGYDALTIGLYQQEHQGKKPPDDPQDTAWIQWRADKITQFMQQLSRAIKTANPQAIISLSPNPQDFSLNVFLLDWQRWQQLGLIDEMVLQVYRQDQADFLGELSQAPVQTTKQVIPFSIGILSGLKGQSAPIKRIETQVNTVRQQKFAGMSFFFYESLWNLSNEPITTRKTVFQQLFATPAKRPSRLSNIADES